MIAPDRSVPWREDLVLQSEQASIRSWTLQWYPSDTRLIRRSRSSERLERNPVEALAWCLGGSDDRDTRFRWRSEVACLWKVRPPVSTTRFEDLQTGLGTDG